MFFMFLCIFVVVGVVGLLLITSRVRAAHKRRVEEQRVPAKKDPMRVADFHYPLGSAPPWTARCFENMPIN